jgi:hypothetical protein
MLKRGIAGRMLRYHIKKQWLLDFHCDAGEFFLDHKIDLKLMSQSKH